MSAMVTTPDGWLVPRHYVRYLRYVTAHKPPRPGAFWFQFRLDAASRLPWVLWSIAAVEVTRGLAYGAWGHLAFGVGLLSMYSLMLVMAAVQLRDTPATVAVIDAFVPHRWGRKILMAVVPTADREVRVGGYAELLAGFVGDGRQAEVVFLNLPHANHCLIIAARPLPVAAEAAVSEPT